MKLINKVLLIVATFISFDVECAFELPGNIFAQTGVVGAGQLFTSTVQQAPQFLGYTGKQWGIGIMASALGSIGLYSLFKTNPIEKRFHFTPFSDRQLQEMQKSRIQQLAESAQEIIKRDVFPFVGTRQDIMLTASAGSLLLKVGAAVVVQSALQLGVSEDTIINNSNSIGMAPLLGLGAYLTYQTFSLFDRKCKETNGLLKKHRETKEAILEMFPTFQAYRIEEYAGSKPEVIENCIKQMLDPIKSAAHNKKPSTAFLLFGKPGNGKTAMIKKIAKEAGDIPVVEETAGTILSKWYGESEQNIAGLLQKCNEARKDAPEKPVLLFIDEIDGLVGKRSDMRGSIATTEKRVVNQFLPLIEKLQAEGIIVVGATNYKEMIDEAIIRSGRLRPVEVGNPDAQDRKEIINSFSQKFFSKLPSDAAVAKLAEQLEGKTRAEVCAFMSGIVDTLISQQNYKEVVLNHKNDGDLDGLLYKLGMIEHKKNKSKLTSINRTVDGKSAPRTLENNIDNIDDIDINGNRIEISSLSNRQELGKKRLMYFQKKKKSI